MKLINIGFGNMISAARLIAIVSPESAPIKRIIQEARDRGMLIDATYGRRTRAVIIMDTDHVILSAILPETVAGRMNDKNLEPTEEETDEA
ncbi:MAG: DUF370 domain-containing protein [Oscillospiraceae bacterium]|nr:DUF370 domain-containing protein [Oscillospiraceae bacterium]